MDALYDLQHRSDSPVYDKKGELDLNPEEAFYNSSIEVDEITHQYITYLERKLKSTKDLVKELHDEAEAMPSATYWEKKLWKIFKL